MKRRNFLKSAGAVLAGATSLPLLGDINTTPNVISPKYPYVDCVGDLFSKIKGSHKTCHHQSLSCCDGSESKIVSPYYEIYQNISFDNDLRQNSDRYLEILDKSIEDRIQNDMYHTLIAASYEKSFYYADIGPVSDDYIIFCSPESKDKIANRCDHRIITDDKFGVGGHNQKYCDDHFPMPFKGEMALAIKPDPNKFIVAYPEFSKLIGFNRTQKYNKYTGVIESTPYQSKIPHEKQNNISILSVQTILILDNKNVVFLDIT